MLGAVLKIVALSAWTLGVVGAALAGFRQDPYLAGVRAISGPHPYPSETVGWVVFLTSVQVLVLLALLYSRTSLDSVGRCLLALFVSFAFLGVGLVGSMHAPPPWSVYVLWLVVVFLVLLVFSGRAMFAVVTARTGT